MDGHADGLGFTEYAIILLAAAIVAVPLAKRLGLGSVLGYLFAGILIGPVTGIVSSGGEILHFAELGVVLLLFVIGLELKPSRLWAMRKDIFGLGAAQVILTGMMLAVAASFIYPGYRAPIVIGFALALSSTAFGLQILQERGDRNTRYGQKSFAILLLQDLAIVPLLAMTSILAPPWAADAMGSIGLSEVLTMLGGLAILILAGRYLLNPMFRILAKVDAREIMTAAALFIVLGAAMLMQWVGLSMAMGAFIAGVLLAESTFRHELEADIEPFRGLLLGLFFMAVGLSLNLDVIASNWALILIGAPTLMLIKSAIIYGLVRVTGEDHNCAIRVALLLPQAGEFGFVIFGQAAGSFIMTEATASVLTAMVTLSMMLTPFSVALAQRLLRMLPEEEMEEDFADVVAGTVLMVGFSRFGHIAAQHLLAEGVNVTIIDNNPERIRNAARFGFKIYYGDGRRLDVLRAAGAEEAEVIAICVHSPSGADNIVDLVRNEFPLAKIYVRSYDRVHTLELLEKGVDFQIRETFESAMIFGSALLEAVGISPDRAEEVATDVRRRDLERLGLQQVEGVDAGMDLLHRRTLQPEPLTEPKRASKPLSEETAELARTDEDDAIDESARKSASN
ncbi:MAG: monovalent cation:proton antiporter-2 (CPA2) family protein [Pseudomonadota bacterium]